ncbi:GPP34 family phosphoprotein [Microbacterium sp.]|uniref:GOLPH3/VPS74 family protein n=1 Tax=Microbacterium sp. TaxID=51671 RepID=UPI002811B086|nr:GPP34 family phosphoprotein [Microbacterium sp.]
MNDRTGRSTADEPETGGDGASLGAPTLAEDLLLLLFQPHSGAERSSGTIAGENTLFYALGGAVLADLALGERIRTTEGRGGAVTVETIEGRRPVDRLLGAAWDHIAEKPRGVQAVLAAVGPTLRGPVLDRLVDRGDIRLGTRRVLGLFDAAVLEDGGSGRRAELVSEVRGVLVDGAVPSPRTAALAALLYGSGTLPQFHPAIPWTSPVIARAEELKRGSWGAGGAAEAVARTMTATIVNNVIVAAALLPRT